MQQIGMVVTVDAADVWTISIAGFAAVVSLGAACVAVW